MRSAVAAIIAMTVTAVEAPAQGAAAADEAAIRSVVERVFEGMRRADSAMVRPLFHPAARLITATDTGARVEASIDGFVRSVGRARSEVWDERLSNVTVSIDGPLASVWADYAFYRGATFSHCGVDHFLLVRRAGTWAIIELADTRRTTGCPR